MRSHAYASNGARLQRIVTIDCLDQADCTDLFEIGAIETAAHEATRRAPTEVPVFRDKAFAERNDVARKQRATPNLSFVSAKTPDAARSGIRC